MTCRGLFWFLHVWILGRQETLIALIIGQHLCLCFYCLLRIPACACAIKSKQTATSHLLCLCLCLLRCSLGFLLDLNLTSLKHLKLLRDPHLILEWGSLNSNWLRLQLYRPISLFIYLYVIFILIMTEKTQVNLLFGPFLSLVFWRVFFAS